MREQENSMADWSHPTQRFCFCSVGMFCLLIYVNINTEPRCCHKCNGSKSLIWYRPADNPAAVMICLHAGKIRPHTQVLPLLSPRLPAPITHVYCTQRRLLIVCRHTNARYRDTRFACGTDTETYLPRAHQTARKPPHISWPCTVLFAPSGAVRQDDCAIRKERRRLRGHHGWQPTWSQSQHMSIQLHQTNRQIAAQPASQVGRLF